MKKKKKWFYVVWIGRKTGIFKTWQECQIQISGFEGNKFKKFPSLKLADKAFLDGWEKYYGIKKRHIQKGHSKQKRKENDYRKNSIISLNIQELIEHINEFFDEESKKYIKDRI